MAAMLLQDRTVDLLLLDLQSRPMDGARISTATLAERFGRLAALARRAGVQLIVLEPPGLPSALASALTQVAALRLGVEPAGLDSIGPGRSRPVDGGPCGAGQVRAARQSRGVADPVCGGRPAGCLPGQARSPAGEPGRRRPARRPTAECPCHGGSAGAASHSVRNPGFPTMRLLHLHWPHLSSGWHAAGFRAIRGGADRPGRQAVG